MESKYTPKGNGWPIISSGVLKREFVSRRINGWNEYLANRNLRLSASGDYPLQMAYVRRNLIWQKCFVFETPQMQATLKTVPKIHRRCRALLERLATLTTQHAGMLLDGNSDEFKSLAMFRQKESADYPLAVKSTREIRKHAEAAWEKKDYIGAVNAYRSLGDECNGDLTSTTNRLTRIPVTGGY